MTNRPAIAAIIASAVAQLLIYPATMLAQKAPAAQPPPKAGEPARPATTQVGDIRITGYQSISYPPNAPIRIKGPNTLVEAPDKASGAKFALHADDIKLIDAMSATKSLIEMRGNVRYTITQPTPLGERRVSGTAGAADYRRAARKILLTQGVRTELIDPRLEGPGTLRAGTVTVDIAAEPYTFNLSGDSATNDVRFTPKPSPPAKPAPGAAIARPAASSPPAPLGPVHITRWDTGSFQAGKAARFDGADVTADMNSRTGTSRGQLRARHIEGDFTPEGGIARARATNEVHYHSEQRISRAAADGKGKPETGLQEVTGTSREADYEPSAGRTTLDVGSPGTELEFAL